MNNGYPKLGRGKGRGYIEVWVFIYFVDVTTVI